MILCLAKDTPQRKYIFEPIPKTQIVLDFELIVNIAVVVITIH